MKTVPPDWMKFLGWVTDQAGNAGSKRLTPGIDPGRWLKDLPEEIHQESDRAVETWVQTGSWPLSSSMKLDASMLTGTRLLYATEVLLTRMKDEKPCPPKEAWTKVLRRAYLVDWAAGGAAWVSKSPWLSTDWPEAIENEFRSQRNQMN
ncbi:MAG: hypothetical protein ABIS50_11435 [Luteolibacter sp.]|uniref:hypothetical protein n=1 Tax=Luteolibacter sp. TaxID=1962973 RepID=UPI0032668883